MADEAIFDVGGSKNWTGLESSMDSFCSLIELVFLVHDLSEWTASVYVQHNLSTDAMRMADKIESAFQPVNQVVDRDVDLQFSTQSHQFADHFSFSCTHSTGLPMRLANSSIVMPSVIVRIFRSAAAYCSGLVLTLTFDAMI